MSVDQVRDVNVKSLVLVASFLEMRMQYGKVLVTTKAIVGHIGHNVVHTVERELVGGRNVE